MCLKGGGRGGRGGEAPPAEHKACLGLSLHALCHAHLSTRGCGAGEEKFRRVRLTNPAIQQRVAAWQGAVDFLLLAGFHKDASGENLEMPEDKVGGGGVGRAQWPAWEHWPARRHRWRVQEAVAGGWRLKPHALRASASAGGQAGARGGGRAA